MKSYTLHHVFTAVIIIIILFQTQHLLSAPASPRIESGPGSSALEDLEYNPYFFERRRDPIFAGFLSWYVPGLGQYYSGRIWKGTAFLVTEYTLLFCAIFYFLDFDFSAGNGSGFQIRADAKRTDLGVVETSRRNVFIGMLSVVFLIHIYNVSDAVQSAKDFNNELEIKRRELQRKYPFVYTSNFETRSMYIGFQHPL
jgi:TM2 domain-containing membrane protein YozV